MMSTDEKQKKVSAKDETKKLVKCGGPNCKNFVALEEVFCSKECEKKAHGF